MYIKRERYLSKIRPFYDVDLIKVLTGVRRCGKSILLEQIKEEFIENQNLLVLLDWTFPEKENDEEVAQQKLDEFMRKMEQRKPNSLRIP